MSKIKDILESRYSSDSNIPEWTKKRREICNSCEFNSKNKQNKTITEKAWVSMNHGKDTCLKCKCMLSAKTKIDYAICPEGKWQPVNHFKHSEEVEVENISNTKVKVSKNREVYEVEYPDLVYDQDTDVQFLIRDKGNKMSNLNSSTSCNCTIPDIISKENEHIFTIEYNTKKKGEFAKTVKFLYDKKGLTHEIIFKIKGRVI